MPIAGSGAVAEPFGDLKLHHDEHLGDLGHAAEKVEHERRCHVGQVRDEFP